MLDSQAATRCYHLDTLQSTGSEVADIQDVACDTQGTQHVNHMMGDSMSQCRRLSGRGRKCRSTGILMLTDQAGQKLRKGVQVWNQWTAELKTDSRHYQLKSCVTVSHTAGG